MITTPSTRPKVFLHVGAAKSGTTYVQHAMRRNQGALAARGVLYPGKQGSAHVFAALDLRGARMGREPDPNPEIDGAWPRLVREVAEWTGSAAVISHELFAPAGPRQIARALRDLDFADVHIVWTIRALSSVLPGAWQESVRNGGTATLDDYVAAISKSRPTADGWVDPADDEWTRFGRKFWQLHDARTTLARWSAALPNENVHVVTVPLGGSRDVLWSRFASVIGADDVGADESDGESNASMGTAEAEIMRRFNVAADESVPWGVYNRVVKHGVARRLAGRDGHRVALTDAEFAQAMEWSQEDARAIGDAGYSLVGTADDLTSATRKGGSRPTQVTDTELVDAGISAMVALTHAFMADFEQQTGRVGRQARARQETLRQLRAAEKVLAEHRALTPSQRIKRCAVELSQQVGWLRGLRSFYIRLRGRR